MSKELDYIDMTLKCEPLTLNARTIIESIKEKIQRLEAIEKGKNTDIIDNYMAFKNDNANPSKDIMKSYNLLNNTAKIIENIDFNSSMTVNFNIAFDVMSKSFAEQTNDDIVNFLYEKYKDTNITRVFLLSKPDFEKFLLEMLPIWCKKETTQNDTK